MNFSGISNKTLMGIVLRRLLSLIPPQTQLPILQGKLRGKKWITGSGNHGYWLGSYELAKQKLFIETVTRGSVVYDIGGNVGFYTLLASDCVGPEGKVFVFEPIPRNLVYLEKHLQINHITNVKVFGVAVSDQCGTVRFDEGNNSSVGHISQNGRLDVRSVSIDELVDQAAIAKPDFIKIDVEGAEFVALNGSRHVLTTYHPTLFLATHGREVHQECLSLLTELGYELSPIDCLSLEQSSEIIASHGTETQRGLTG